MHQDSSDRVTMDELGNMTLRVLIGSYFLAVALNIIPGTNLAILFSTVLPAPWDSALAAGSVFILAFMVMIGSHTRLAALVLAMMTFFASYLTMIQIGVEHELGSFWRDIALIAALILTYSEQDRKRGGRGRVIRRQVQPRRMKLTTPPRDPRPQPILRRPIQFSKAKAASLDPDMGDIDNIFADV